MSSLYQRRILTRIVAVNFEWRNNEIIRYQSYNNALYICAIINLIFINFSFSSSMTHVQHKDINVSKRCSTLACVTLATTVLKTPPGVECGVRSSGRWRERRKEIPGSLPGSGKLLLPWDVTTSSSCFISCDFWSGGDVAHWGSVIGCLTMSGSVTLSSEESDLSNVISNW